MANGPDCGHPYCRQHYIDTDELCCIAMLCQYCGEPTDPGDLELEGIALWCSECRAQLTGTEPQDHYDVARDKKGGDLC